MRGCEGGCTLVEPGLPLYLQGQQPLCFGSQVVNSDPSLDIRDEIVASGVTFEKKRTNGINNFPSV